MFKEKGFALVHILILGTLVVMGSFLLLRGQLSKTSYIEDVSQTPYPKPTEIPMEQDAIITSSVVQPGSKNSCDAKKDICFEADDLNVTIYEGYLEDADNWISEQVMLNGKGSGGYKLKIEGFPKEISARSPVQDFKDDSKQKIYLRAQKNVTRKGSYSGKISVYSYLSGNTTTSNLTINYADSDKEQAVHTYPFKIVLNCKVMLFDWPGNQYINCGAYEPTYIIKFYYPGKHEGIEVKTLTEKDAKRTLKLRTIDKSTTFNMNDTQMLYIELEGFPKSEQLGEEPSAEYNGFFVFIDQATQKEIHQASYTLKVTK